MDRSLASAQLGARSDHRAPASACTCSTHSICLIGSLVTIKAILDTNVVISGIFWKGVPFEILKAWREHRFSPCDNVAYL
jgi:hypothetical protein